VQYDEQLRLAIENKRLIRVGYKQRVRLAEPHDYGVQKGSARVLVFQLRTDGPAAGSSEQGWRLLELTKIESLDVLDETFAGSRGSAHVQHYAWDRLYARVAS